MNIRAVPAWKAAGLAQLYGSNHETTTARKFAFRITRRQFGGSVAGTAVIGGALASGLVKPGFAKTLASFAPVPIPGGTPGLGGHYHVFGPGPAMGGDPIDAEPITITDFNGFVGLAYLNGMVTRTNTKTGTSEKFPFLNSDMRFMDGEFQGTDGHIHQGTFALV
jgi:hypothetical protein